ncbi:MAG: winged helix-turn-helix domain-containing protein [Fidelibacterota bacterium]
MNRLWEYEKIVVDRTIDVHIAHLRNKLGEEGKYIKTIRGIGYKLED